MSILYTSLRALVYMCLTLMILNTPSHAATIEADGANAVVYVYQRVGDNGSPQISISTEQFQEHIRELQSDNYTVMSLPKIIDAIKNGESLPQRTVAITFEGAYIATLGNAMPLLDAANFPYTIFFSTDMADGSNPGHLTFNEIKNLRKNKLVTIGILPSAYTHMVDLSTEQNASLINKAVAKYREMFNEEPEFFAWPYGEYSAALKKQLSNYSFKAAFGQHSGVLYKGADLMALPRFTMTDMFGDIDRFRLTASALPLPVTDVTPDDMSIKQNPPLVGFTVTPELTSLSKLSCFASGIGKIAVKRLGGSRVEIRIDEPLEDRRTRINCTLPDDTVIPGQGQIWRWFGMQLIEPAYTDEAPPENVTEPE